MDRGEMVCARVAVASKQLLLFEPRTLVTSLPYHLHDHLPAGAAGRRDGRAGRPGI